MRQVPWHLGFVFGVVVASWGAVASAGTGEWTSIGPLGATVCDLGYSIDGSELWAASGTCGVLRSTNEGSTWTRIASGIGEDQVISVTQSPHDSTKWMAVTQGSLLACTSTGTPSWTSLLGIADADLIAAGEYSRSNSGNLFAGSALGFFRSTDSGSTWTAVTSGLPGGGILTIATNPHSTSQVWVGTESGVYKSSDDGQTFTSTSAGLEILPHKIVRRVYFDPNSASTIYLGTWYGVFKSTDSGSTWVREAGVPADTLVHALKGAASAGGGLELVAATEDGVFAKASGGWSQVRAGAHRAAAVRAGSWVVADNNGGLHRTTDSGSSWSALTPAGRPDVTDMAVNGNTVYLVTSDRTYESTRLWSSGSFGGTWSEVTTLPTGHAATRVTVDSGGTILIGSSYPATSALLKSSNAGSTWTEVGRGPQGFMASFYMFACLESHPTTPGKFSVMQRPGERGHLDYDIFTSADAGATWAGISPAVTGHTLRGTVVRIRGSSEIWAGGFGADGAGVLLVSLNGGSSWTRVGTALFTAPITDIALDALGSAVWVSTAGQGTFVTSNGGANFFASQGLTDLNVLSLAKATQASVLFCGTNAGGVFRSTDGGFTWAAVTGLNFAGVRTVRTNATGNAVLAGTRGGGVWHFAFP